MITLILILLIILIEKSFAQSFYKRGDGATCIDYALPSEFDNLSKRKIAFKSKKETLRGFVYKDKSVTNFKAVIVIAHGIGFGHFYLLNLVSYFAKNGYIVFCYDQASSGMSSGKKIDCMSRASLDIDYALRFKENDDELKNYDTYLFGHSWGGFTVLSALNLKHKIKKVISVAGFNSEADLATATTPKIKPFGFIIRLRNFIHYGRYAFFDASKGIIKSPAKIRYYQGDKDLTISPKLGLEFFKKYEKDNFEVIALKDKGHTPFINDESQKLQQEVLVDLGLLGGKEVDVSYFVDFRKLSLPDNDVYQCFLEFFDK